MRRILERSSTSPTKPPAFGEEQASRLSSTTRSVRTNSESQDRTFVGRCFRTEAEACTGLGYTKLSRDLAWYAALAQLALELRTAARPAGSASCEAGISLDDRAPFGC